jgi:hypothetical protein
MFIAGAFDIATYGSVSMDFSDTAGSHSITPFTTGKYEHEVFCINAGVTSPALTLFATALAAAMNAASPTQNYDVEFSEGRYTISVDSGAWAPSFTGAAGLRMKALLGMNVISPGTSITSSTDAWFWLTPAKPGPVNYKPPAREPGQVKEAKPDDGGAPYRNRSTAIARLASWEHHYEPKLRVDRDYNVGASGTGYTWEDLWDDYGLAQMPIGVYIEGADGNYELMAVSLETAEYDASVYQRMRPIDDDRFKITVMARLWRASGTDTWARAFNA